MAEHNESGSLAEQLASEYLANSGYGIIHRNWRYLHKEIDIVAEKNNTLVIVEVKSRFGKEVTADELLSMQKLKHVVDAAEAYIQKFGIDLETRFDIIIITFGEGKNDIEHIENAFVPGVNW
jgi:putative endonuclease